MQKVKDRKEKLEQRSERARAVQEQIEQAEKQKDEFLEGLVVEEGGEDDGGTNAKPQTEQHSQVDRVTSYTDEGTKSHWGGHVIVTTTTRVPGDESDEERHVSSRKCADEEQEYAGRVERFITELKRKTPAKRSDKKTHYKGKHGAANMKGMASSGDLKIAQKALSRSLSKANKHHHGKRGRR